VADWLSPVVAGLIDSTASRSFNFAPQVMQSMSRLPKSLHSRWLPAAKIYETDRFPRRMDRKTVHMDRKTVGMDREEIHMNRRAIHITRKTNRATTDMDCAIIHMDRASVPKGKLRFL
jgi:hypothetical protein